MSSCLHLVEASLGELVLHPERNHVDTPGVGHARVCVLCATVGLPSKHGWRLFLVLADEIFTNDAYANVGNSCLLLS